MKLARITIPHSILAGMRNHVEISLPNEACGLLGGKDGNVNIHIPVRNMVQSPIEFRMDPEEQLRGLMLLDEQNVDLLAIYHSHPTGAANPSLTDLRSHLYPEAACIILARKTPGWSIQAFWITEGNYSVILLDEAD